MFLKSSQNIIYQGFRQFPAKQKIFFLKLGGPRARQPSQNACRENPAVKTPGGLLELGWFNVLTTKKT